VLYPINPHRNVHVVTTVAAFVRVNFRWPLVLDQDGMIVVR
jgi:hypothetical protein